MKKNTMKKHRTFDFCDCWSVRRPKDAFGDLFSIKKKKDGKLRGEIWEFLTVKSWDEFLDEVSDSCWGVGRLIAGFFGKEYFNIWGDERHYQKKKQRMQKYGCIRSKNNGGCISRGEQ